MLALCVGMYRACSTWQYGVVGAILAQHRSGRRLGFVSGIYLGEKVNLDESDAGWAVLKAHDADEQFAALLAAGRALGIYAYRDLEAVVFSYMHVAGLDFETVIEQGFVELCLHNDRFWRAQPGMLVQHYEDLIARPAEGVVQIARHLGVDLEVGEAERIAAALSWEANRRQVAALADRRRTDAADPDLIDPVSLLHWNHIRAAGPSGAPKRGTAEQRRLIEQCRRAWLARHGLVEPVEVELVPVGVPEPIGLTSHTLSAVDLRLDRLFRGVRGVAVEFDAPEPCRENPTYLLYRHGWRIVSIGTTAAPRDRFVLERPTDLSLAACFDPPTEHPGSPAEFAAATLGRLVAPFRVPDPAIALFHPASAVDLLIPAMLLTRWRPQVVVVDHPRSRANDPAWAAGLHDLGYLAVPLGDGPRLYLRGDRRGDLRWLTDPLAPHRHVGRAGPDQGPAEPPQASLSGRVVLLLRRAQAAGRRWSRFAVARSQPTGRLRPNPSGTGQVRADASHRD